jgi:hypothetical protein
MKLGVRRSPEDPAAKGVREGTPDATGAIEEAPRDPKNLRSRPPMHWATTPIRLIELTVKTLNHQPKVVHRKTLASRTLLKRAAQRQRPRRTKREEVGTATAENAEKERLETKKHL